MGPMIYYQSEDYKNKSRHVWSIKVPQKHNGDIIQQSIQVMIDVLLTSSAEIKLVQNSQ